MDPEDPVVFWFKVGNEQFAKLPEEGVPNAGVTSVGELDRTFDPEPVEVVTPVPPEPTAKVADKPAAVPDVFWLSVGNVQFAKLPEDGVPNAGVTSAGELDKTTEPEPVEDVTPVPPEATAKVADKPAAVPDVFWLSVGNVQFVNVPEEGVPNAPPEVR